MGLRTFDSSAKNEIGRIFRVYGGDLVGVSQIMVQVENIKSVLGNELLKKFRTNKNLRKISTDKK